mgnify:CR=1 FL=1
MVSGKRGSGNAGEQAERSGHPARAFGTGAREHTNHAPANSTLKVKKGRKSAVYCRTARFTLRRRGDVPRNVAQRAQGPKFGRLPSSLGAAIRNGLVIHFRLRRVTALPRLLADRAENASFAAQHSVKCAALNSHR